jgi:C1A family cysteine protease
VAKTGLVPMPRPGEKSQGGHCVLIVGYDQTKKWFICRNSWGVNWGDKGYFYLPYEFVENPNYCDDFWALQKI